MVCESCGEKKKKTCDNNFPKAVVEINNPETLVLLRKVMVPTSMGDETVTPPSVGKYCNVVLQYEINGHVYLYSSDGIPTLLTSDIKEIEEILEKIEQLDEEVAGKQDKLIAGDNITIEDNVISAVAATYVAGDNIQINGNVISATDTIYDDTEVKSDITNLQNAVQGIEEKIPSAASSANQLADKNFVNSSIATNTANFIGTFNSVAELEAYSGTLTNNDYAFVVVTDAAGNTAYDRYKYNGDTEEWLFEYELNNSSFTSDQWAAINSGITSGDVTKLGNLADIQTIGANLSLDANGELSATDTTYTAGTGLSLNGTEFSVDTTVIAEKSDIPTVNNATLTITQNGTSAGTFTANSATDTTIALTDTTYSNYTGATSQIDGTAGLVPAPLAGDETKFLSGNGQWTTVSQYSLPIASANDLGGIKVGNNLTVDPSTGVLDATDTTYSAGTNVQISAGNIISATDTTYSAFTGTDGQTAGTAGLVPAPATTDAGKFLKADGTWDTVGGASFEPTILTSADYNYPADNPTWLALWLLPTGYYRVGQNNLKVRIHTNMLLGGVYSGVAFYIDASPSSYSQIVALDEGSGVINRVGYSCLVNKSNGVAYTQNNNYSDGLNLACYDGLNNSDARTPLSAKQGKVLNDKIEGRVITGAGAPTTSTVGTVGKLYEDTTNGKLYICTDATNPYVWEEVGSGGGGASVFTTNEWNALWA